MKLIYYKKHYYLIDENMETKYNDICFYHTNLVKIWGVNKSNYHSHSFKYLDSGSNAYTFGSNLVKVIKTDNIVLIKQHQFSDIELLKIEEIRNIKLKDLI